MSQWWEQDSVADPASVTATPRRPAPVRGERWWEQDAQVTPAASQAVGGDGSIASDILGSLGTGFVESTTSLPMRGVSVIDQNAQAELPQYQPLLDALAGGGAAPGAPPSRAANDLQADSYAENVLRRKVQEDPTLTPGDAFTLQSRVSEMVDEPGYLPTPEDLGMGDPRNTPAWERAQAVDDWAARNMPIRPEFAESLEGQVVRGVGTLLGSVAQAPLLGPAAPGAFMLQLAGEGASDAASYPDATGEQISQVGRMAAPTGLLELAPVGAVLGATGIARGAISGALSEAFAEGGQQTGQNIAIQQAVDPERGTFENVPESMLVGSIVGGGVGAGAGGVSALRGRDEPEATTEPETPAFNQSDIVAFETYDADGNPVRRMGVVQQVDADRLMVETTDGSTVSVGLQTQPRLISQDEMDLLLSEVATLDQILNSSPQVVANAAARLRQRRQQGGSQQPQEVSQETILANDERIAADQAAVEEGTVDPGAAAQPVQRREPPPTVAVDSQGRANTLQDEGATIGMGRQDQVEAQARADAEEAFRLADIQRRRGPEYQEQRQETERQFTAEEAYRDLSERIGQDPAELANRIIGIAPEEFRLLSPETQERIVANAQRQEAAQRPGEPLATSDAALSEQEGFTPAGEQGRYSPASTPMSGRRNQVVNEGQEENRAAPQSRTATEQEAAGFRQPQGGQRQTQRAQQQPRMASGTSDRPFQFRDDSSGLDADQARFFQERAERMTQEQRRAAEAELEQEWARRRQEKEQQARQEDDRARNRQNSRGRTTSTPPERGPDGRFPVNDEGFLSDTEGRAVRFPTKRAAARWAVDNEQGADFDMVAADADSDAVYLRANGNYGERTSGNGQQDTRQQDEGPTADGDNAAADVAATVEGTGDGAREGEAATGEGEGGQAGGTTLYGGIPGDRIVDLLLRPAIEWGRKVVQSFRSELMGTAADISALSRRASPRDGWRSVRDLQSYLLNSSDGHLRIYGEKLKSPTFEALLNQTRAQAGVAADVGATFKEAFDRRYGEFERRIAGALVPFKDNPSAQERIRELVQNRRRISQRGGPVHEAAREVADLLDNLLSYLRDAGVEVGEIENYFPREIDRQAALRRQDAFLDRASQLYQREGLSRDDARDAAQRWLDRIMFGGDMDILGGRTGRVAGENFLKERVFGPEADKLLKDFFEPEMIQSLMSYARRAVRRAETARRFGDRFSDVPAQIDQIRVEAREAGASDVDISFAIEALREHLKLSTGHHSGGVGARRNSLFSWIRTITGLRLLDSATLTSLTELLMPSIRTHNLSLAARQLLRMPFHMLRQIAKLGPTQRWAALREMTEDIGAIIGSSGYANALARFGGGDVSSNTQSKILQNFFSKTLQTGFTEYTNTLSTEAGVILFKRAAKTLLGRSHGWGIGGKSGAGFLLREAGIPEALHEKFAREILSFGRDLPVPSRMSPDVAEALRTGLLRIDRQSVQMPDATTRPQWASTPIGRMVFQLRNFTMTFGKNVLGREWNMSRSKDLDTLAKAQLLLTSLPMLALMWPLQFVLGRLRWFVRAGLIYGAAEGLRAIGAENAADAVDDIDDDDPTYSTAAEWELALSRSGLLGDLDTWIQIVSQTRYDKSLVEGLVGVSLGQTASDIEAVIESIMRNSENTNTAERNLVNTALELGVEPLYQAVVTSILPAGIGSFLAAQAPDDVRPGLVTALAGERGQASSAARSREIRGLYDFFFGADDDGARGSTYGGSEYGSSRYGGSQYEGTTYGQ